MKKLLYALTAVVSLSANAQSYKCEMITHNGFIEADLIDPIEVNNIIVKLGDNNKVAKMDSSSGVIVSFSDGNKMSTSPAGMYAGLNILRVVFSHKLEKYEEGSSIKLTNHGDKLPESVMTTTASFTKGQKRLQMLASQGEKRFAQVFCELNN